MHRFFLTDRPLEPDQEVDLSPLSHQLRTVLRMGPGQRILLLDGRGQAYPTEITALDRREARGRVLETWTLHTEPRVHVSLYLCALRRERFEWVLQKGTEIGVACFIPVLSARTVVRPLQALRRKYPRWQAILREAAEQSGRARIPELADPLVWEQAVAEGQGLRLLLWEEAVEPGLGDALSRSTEGPDGGRVSLLVGPEGGMEPQEVRQARAAGWTPVSLGPRTLRAETAALVAAALVLHRLGDLG